MNRKIKTIALALTVFLLICLSSIVGPFLLHQSSADVALKPQVVALDSLFAKGLNNGDPELQYSSLVRTDQVEAKLMNLMSFPKHYHEKENHFFYVLKGQANIRIGSFKSSIIAGDFIVIPAGKQYEHELKVIGDQPMQLLVFGSPPEE